MSARDRRPDDDQTSPGESTSARIHALWDELADFGAHDTDAALVHALRAIGDLIDAQNAFWIGAVRLGSDGDSLHGWRLRAMRRLTSTREDERIVKLARHQFDRGIADPITLAQTGEAGVFRSRLLRELAPPDFFESRNYELLYRSRQIDDAIFAVFPVNQDAESYFGWYRIGAQRGQFSTIERDLVARALRPLRWFHRQVMLGYGLLVANAPLAPVERRLMSLLLTERSEKEIAHDLALTVATTHGYITDLFRKFGVSGRSGLTALWLGKAQERGRRHDPR